MIFKRKYVVCAILLNKNGQIANEQYADLKVKIQIG